MDKVDLSSTSLLNPSLLAGLRQDTKKVEDRKKTGKSRKNIFSELLDRSAAELGPLREFAPSEEVLVELMDAVHSAGSDLLDRPFHDEIIKYKKAVRDFVHYVVENCYEIHRTQGIKKKVASRGEAEWKTPLFHQVNVVDKKLEELAADILSGQHKQLKIVSKMDEITGLLVDLTISGMIRVKDD